MGERPNEAGSLMAVRLAMSFVLVVLSVGVARAQSFSPYSDFQAMSLQQLATLQVQVSYVGPSDAPLLPVTFSSPSNLLDPSKFLPFRRPGFVYASGPGVTFTATVEQLQAVITNVGTLPTVTAGGVSAPPGVSFTLVNLGKGFEAVLNKAGAIALFDQLRLSLAGNRDGLVALGTLACPLALLEAGTPADASPIVGIAFSGVRLDRKTGRFVGTATMTNTSPGPLAAPVSLVVLPQNNISLATVDGTTCGTTPVGAPFINLPGDLAPGQSATVTLEFINPDRLAIAPTAKVLAGPGAR